MKYQLNLSRRLFLHSNHVLLALLALLCFFPLLHVVAISFSSSHAVEAGRVVLWPVDFTAKAYQFVSEKPEFLRSLWITFQREFLAVPISMLLIILVAYPLSREKRDFRYRTVYVWIFVFSMLFHGGLIPTYLLIHYLGLINTRWALVLPHAVPIFSVILLLNFFRSIPRELLEAGFIDGAGHWRVLVNIMLPVSLPALATITLFTTVSHWNQWFDGIIFMNNPDNYPLQSYLRTVIVGRDLTKLSESSLEELANLSDRNIRAAQIFLGALPILLVYPFLQRFFMSGIVMGSVKE